MEKEKYLNDLIEIRKIMSRSSRFLSLSGLSGVSTGLIAMAGALLAEQLVFSRGNYLLGEAVMIGGDLLRSLVVIAGGTLLLSIASALWFTIRKSRREKLRVWDAQAERLLFNLMIPLVAGGIVSIILLRMGYVGFLPAMTLLFYGLALVNGSHYTLSHIRYLGLAEILLGLLALIFIGQSLYIWMLGFGLFQMVYGLLIQRKREEV